MFDIVQLIKTVGYFGIFGIVFAESGLFIGFFLPGDSLLFTAGFLASQGFMNIRILLTLTFLGAVLGDSFGYAFGRKVGPAIFIREDSVFFHKHHLERARAYYDKYGKLTIILARFLPVIRTFAPILAGVGRMHYPTFLIYNLIGGAIWGLGLPLLGYYLGNVIPDIDRYLIPIVIGIIIVSSIPPALHFFRHGREKTH